MTPVGAQTVVGDVGGPFAPQTYTLSNTGAAPLAWTAANTQPWANLSATSGTLAPGANTTVTLSFNASANALPMGAYGELVTFTNITSGFGQMRAITLIAQSGPLITGFAPTAVASGMSVTITGAGFVAPVTVRFNGVNATSVNVVSPTQIIAVAPTTLTAGSWSATGARRKPKR